MIEKILKEINRLKNELNGYSALEALDYIESYINTLQEESSNDLEEEMIKWHKEYFGNKRDWNKTSGEYLTRKSQLDIAHHFAEWQEKKMLGIAEAFYQQGRYEQEQEMMKDAVETIIVNDWQYGKDPDHAVIPAIHQRIDGFNVGDKVRIIIVKTEQQ